MSRIQEALRVANLPGGSHGSSAAVARTEPDQSLLARFPRERRPELPGAVPRTVASAPPRAASPAAAAGLTFGAGLEGRLVGWGAPSVAVEQYRRLAGGLYELQVLHGTKTLMVTSALPREGKTLTVVNLALTLSGSYGLRVLLVDADLRRPSLHEIFGVPNTCGLSEGLRSDAGGLQVVEITPQLSVLPGGRPDSDPMAALTSDRMQALLDEAAGAFDWVLLDAPPAGLMPDANLIARLTQGVLFVIGAGVTPHALVERALNEIGRDNVVGTVLNRIDETDIPATGYYEQYYMASAATK